MARFTLDVNAPGDAPVIAGNPRASITRLKGLLGKMASGSSTLTSASLVARQTGVCASGTLTMATLVVNSVVDVNGVLFTAIANGVAPVAGEQTFALGTGGTIDADTATALAAAINAYAGFAGVLTAVAVAAVVTVTSTLPGALGNAITITMRGVRASTTATCASCVPTDTLTVNGTALTAICQRASGTLTAISAVAGNTCSVQGYLFTGKAGAATAGGLDFSIDTSDAATGISIAAQINGFAGLTGIVTATDNGAGVVTVRAVKAGTAGNALILLGTVTTLAASGTGTLAGGIAVANNQFDVSPGATDSQVAADIVRCLNASSTAAVNTFAYATHAAAVVTVRAKTAGTLGNAITLVSAGGTITVAAARLAGGTETSHSQGGARATGTITLTAWPNGKKVTINGVDITANTNTQANNQVDISGADSADALNLALAINNSTTAGLADVIATASSAIVTVTARKGGISGNAITMSSDDASAVCNVARLAGGAAPTTAVPSADRLASGSNDAAITLSF